MDSTAGTTGAGASATAPPTAPVGWRWVVAMLALVLGYADLWRGGITVGPIALVLGYGVLLPHAIVGGSTAVGTDRTAQRYAQGGRWRRVARGE